MKATDNFKRMLAVVACYVTFMIMPVTSPLGWFELSMRLGLAVVVLVVAGAAIWTGDWVERIVSTAFGAPALWYLLRTMLPILAGGLHFADA